MQVDAEREGRGAVGEYESARAAAIEGRFEEPGSFDGAIIFCPVCSTHEDAEPDVTGWVEFECNNCSTVFRVKIDPEIIAEHAGVG